jgi:hypothetical protein
MHVLMVIAGGMVLLGLFALFGHLWGGNLSGVATALKVFVTVWVAVSIVNMWVGVSRAGYSAREELPILLIVFAVPAAAAAFLLWRLSRQ